MRNNFNWHSKGVRLLYHTYKKQAAKRNIPFELSKETFSNIVLSKNCQYCNTPAFQTSYGTLVLGIDRVDNEIGYVDDNCIPCCVTCNRLKGTKTEKQFLDA